MKWRYWFSITIILTLFMLFSRDIFFFVLFISWIIWNLVDILIRKFVSHTFSAAIIIQSEVQRNQRIPLTIQLKHHSLLPVAKALLFIQAENRLTNEMMTKVLPLSIGRKNEKVLTIDVQAQSCGQWHITLQHLIKQGVFPWSKTVYPLQTAASFISWPTIFPIQIISPFDTVDEEIPVLQQQQTLRSTSERLGLRPYRMGDSIKQIHWKLSAKQDELVVQEHLEQQQSAVAFYIEKRKDTEQYDTMLSMLFSLLNACMQQTKLAFIEINGIRYECSTSQQLGHIAWQLLQGKKVTMPKSFGSCIAIVADESVPASATALRYQQSETDCRTPFDFTKETMDQHFASVIL